MTKLDEMIKQQERVKILEANDALVQEMLAALVVQNESLPHRLRSWLKKWMTRYQSVEDE